MSTLTPEQVDDLTRELFAQIIIASPVNSDWADMHTTAQNTVYKWIRKNSITVQLAAPGPITAN